MQISKKLLFAIGLFVLLIIGAMIYLVQINKTREIVQETRSVMTTIPSANSDFYIGMNTTEAVIVEREVEIPVATTQIVEVERSIVIEPEPPIKQESFLDKLNIDYNFFTPTNSSNIQAMKKLYKSANTYKKSGGVIKPVNVIFDDDFNLNQAKKEAQEINSDVGYLEYEAIALPRIKTTYPVDLDRVLIEGSKIDIALNGELNSELAGAIEGWVVSDIYGFHSNNILLPQGTLVIGSYEPIQKIGQERLNVIWNRAIRPDGVSIRFDRLGEGFMTTDLGGQSGIYGEIDSKFSEKYGLSFLLSLMNASLQAGVSVENEAAQTFASNIGANFSQITTEILQQNIDINPTLRLDKATILQIRVMNDIWFKTMQGYVN